MEIRRTATALLVVTLTACGGTTSGGTGSGINTQPAAGAAGQTGKPGSTTRPPSAGAAASSTTGGSSGQQAAGVGDTLELEGADTKMAVTLVKVVDPARGKEFSKPQSGSRFVAVQVALKNIGDGVYDDAPSNGAKLVDAEGQNFDTTIADVIAGPSFPGTVKTKPGSTAKGFLVFEVPKQAKLSEFQFTLDSGFADETGEWSLK